LAALRDETPPPDLPQYSESLLAELGFGMAALQSVRWHGTKYIRAPRPELYDLHTDPREGTNRFTPDDARVVELAGTLDGVLADSAKRAAPTMASPMDRQTVEMLQALGYLAPATDRASMGGVDPKDGLVVYEKLERARHRAQRGDWQGARTLLEEILTASPRHVSARNILGLAAVRLGDPAEAERQYLASLALEPHQHRVHALLGQLAIDRDDLAAAERHFTAALELTPTFAEAMAYLGYVHVARGDTSGAEAWWHRGQTADPAFPLFFRQIADEYFTREDFARALTFYDRTLAAVPQHFGALVQASNCARELGDVPGAKRYLERARAARPDSWIPPYNLACVLATSGDTTGAVDMLDAALATGFQQPDLLQANEDLVALHDLPAWPRLLADAAANANNRQRGRKRTDAASAPAGRPTSGDPS
jgi:Tfp pilus assembly protein PilF